MKVIMNSSLANSSASGWYKSVESSMPSTFAMQVVDVEFYQLLGSGDTVTGANGTASSGGMKIDPPTPVAPTVSIKNPSPGAGTRQN